MKNSHRLLSILHQLMECIVARDLKMTKFWLHSKAVFTTLYISHPCDKKASVRNGTNVKLLKNREEQNNQWIIHGGPPYDNGIDYKEKYGEIG